MMWHLGGGAVPHPRAAPGHSSHVPGVQRPPMRRLIDKDLLWETYRARNLAFSRHMADKRTIRANGSDRHIAYDLGWITSYYRGMTTGRAFA